MDKILVGYVFRVKRYTDGSIDVGFFSDDEEIELHYSTESSKGTLTKEIAHALAETIGHNILAEICFNEEDISTSVELEEINLEEDSSE